MSLSDNASMCLMNIIKKIAALNVTEKEYREIIHRSLLEKLRKGLKSQTEVLRFAIKYSLSVDFLFVLESYQQRLSHTPSSLCGF